jgi:DNA invertase Pin-like site-specific DNA recombinase
VKAIGYIRVSTAEQAETGYSLEAQRRKIDAYADLYGIKLLRVEVDAGESAKNLERPGIQRALVDLKRGRADALLVVKLDRLTRSVADLAMLLKSHFQKRTLLSIEEKVDTSTAGGELVLNLLTSVGQWERKVIGERTKAGKALVRALGRWVGGDVEYGWRLEIDPTRPPNEQGQPRMRMIPDQVEQAILVQACTLRALGMSLRAVSATLAARGIMSRAGARFAPSAIAAMSTGRSPTSASDHR